MIISVRFFIFLLQLFAVFVTAHGRPNRSPSGSFAGGFSSSGGFPGGFGSDGSFPDGNIFKDQLVSKLCSNQTAVQTLLTKVQQLISTFQSNGSFAQVLADRANEVSYIQSSTSAALLSSNCAGFFTGLKNAKDADDAVMKTRFQYYQIAAAALMQTIGSLFRGSPY